MEDCLSHGCHGGFSMGFSTPILDKSLGGWNGHLAGHGSWEPALGTWCLVVELAISLCFPIPKFYWWSHLTFILGKWLKPPTERVCAILFNLITLYLLDFVGTFAMMYRALHYLLYILVQDDMGMLSTHHVMLILPTTCTFKQRRRWGAGIQRLWRPVGCSVLGEMLVFVCFCTYSTADLFIHSKPVVNRMIHSSDNCRNSHLSLR